MSQIKKWYRINLFTNEIEEAPYIISETKEFVYINKVKFKLIREAKKSIDYEYMFGTYEKVVEHLLYILSYKILKLKDALIKCECDYKALERTIEK